MFRFGKIGKLGAAGSLTLAQRYRGVLKKYGTLSHLWDFGVAQGPLAYAATHTAAEFVAAYPLWPLWQDTAGTVPACKITDPVGLCLDTGSGSVVLGPELFSGIYASNISVNANGTVANGGSSSTATCTTAGVFGLKPNGLATTSGKTYVITFSWSGNVNNRTVGVDMGISIAAGTAASGSITCKPNSGIGGAVNFYLVGGQVGESLTISNISVREVIGAHASQATTTKRPLLSGRVNLLTATEDFSSASWPKGAATVAANSAVAPNGTLTADKLIEAASSTYHYANRGGPGWSINTQYKFSVCAKYAGRKYVRLNIYDGVAPSNGALFDIQNGVIGTHTTGTVTRSIASMGDGWYRCTITATTGATVAGGSLDIALQDADNADPYTGDGTSGIYVYGADLRPANSPTNIPAYQRVTSATDYDTVGFPVRALFDGVDDCLVVPSLDLSMTDKVTVVVGATKLSDAVGALVEFTTNSSSTVGAFGLFAPVNTEGAQNWRSGGSIPASAAITPSAIQAPRSQVLTGTSSISTDMAVLRVNGVSAGTSSADQGTGNYSGASLNIGGRNNAATFPFNGAIQSLAVIGNLLPDGEVQILEASANAAMGKVY